MSKGFCSLCFLRGHKTTIVLIILFTLISSTVFAELTKGDLEEIRSIVKESEERINIRIDGLRSELKDDIASTRAELKDDTSSLRAELKGSINFLTWAIGILALAIVAVIALPQFLGRSKREEPSVTEVRDLRERVNRIEAKLESK